jgi:hypothetical protein
MIKRTYQVVLEAVTPIAHHAETLGNHQMLQRRKVRNRSGRFVEVPYITGDTMRHGLRESAAYSALDAAGLQAGNLSAAALNLLFAGGAITGASGPSVSISNYREMVDVFPPLALLGGCAGNRCIPGKLTVGNADLICAENAHLLPAWAVEAAGGHVCEIDGECCIRAEGLPGQRQHVEIMQRVRMDPSLNPDKRQLLSVDARTAIEGRLLANEDASANGDAVGVEDSKSSMMPRTFEALASGALFFWEATAITHSDLELDTWHVMLGAFLRDCGVGGKRSTGFGRLRPVSGWTRGFDWRSPATGGEAVDPNAIGGRAGDVFRAHMSERTDRLRAFLDGVIA